MIELTKKLAEALDIETQRQVSLAMGIRNTPVKIKINPEEGRSFSFGMSTSLKLGITRLNQPLGFYFNSSENILKAGPVMGVLCDRPVVLYEQKVVSFYKTLAKSAYESGFICYFFTPSQIDFEKEIISGFRYNFNQYFKNDWIIQDFPFPDVVYLQAGRMDEQQKPSYYKFASEFLGNDKAVKLISSYSLNNKLINHFNFLKYPSIKKYLPETVNCNSPESVINLLKKYSSVYLKPTSSSRGLGVYKITKQQDNSYFIEHHESETVKKEEVIHHMDRLHQFIKEIMVKQPYLVQQPVDVIRYDNRPIAFRVHILKNSKGKWDVLKIKAKLGASSGIITGVIWGGYRERAQETLNKIFKPQETQKILEEIKVCTYKISKIIDQIHPGEFGELGFDIVVDKNQQIWMLEVNPKPNWSCPPGDDVKAYEQDVSNHLLGYCLYLLGIDENQRVIGSSM